MSEEAAPAAAQSERRSRRRVLSWQALRRPSPIACALGAWLAAGCFALALRSPGFWSLGFLVFVTCWLAAWRVTGRRTRQEGEPLRGCDPASWLGVGVVPVTFVVISLGSASLGDWFLGPLSVGLFALALWFGGSLLHDRAREALAREDGLSVGPFIDAIAARRPQPAEAAQVTERQARRERMIAVETLLAIVAYGIVSFALLLAFLARHRWGVQITGPTKNTAARTHAATTYVLWNTANLVPGLDIPHTVHWQLRNDFTDHYSGGLLLTLKLFIAIPVLRTAANLWRHG